MINIYTGEGETHAFSLIDALNDECGDASQFRVCYDLACRLSPAVQVNPVIYYLIFRANKMLSAMYASCRKQDRIEDWEISFIWP